MNLFQLLVIHLVLFALVGLALCFFRLLLCVLKSLLPKSGKRNGNTSPLHLRVGGTSFRSLLNRTTSELSTGPLTCGRKIT